MASLRNALGAHELTDKKGGLYRAVFAEFLGTLFLNFFGCGAVVTNNVVAISFAFGIAVASVIQAIGHISGGHINPAVTFGMLAIGKVRKINRNRILSNECEKLPIVHKCEHPLELTILFFLEVHKKCYFESLVSAAAICWYLKKTIDV